MNPQQPGTSLWSKYVAALGFLAWFPFVCTDLFIHFTHRWPIWALAIFLPGMMLFAAMPLAAVAGTLLGTYNLLRGTRGGLD